MTDKRIIDGTDVSECEYYSDADYDYCYMDSSEFGSAYCYDNHYCYYKQLKRKEQECEELRNLFGDPEFKIALTDIRTGEREIWRKLGNKAQKYKRALDKIEKLTSMREVHGLTDVEYVENFRLHQKRILNIINKVKE